MLTCFSSHLDQIFSKPVYDSPCCYTLFTFIHGKLNVCKLKRMASLYHTCLSAANQRWTDRQCTVFLKNSILFPYHNNKTFITYYLDM